MTVPQRISLTKKNLVVLGLQSLLECSCKHPSCLDITAPCPDSSCEKLDSFAWTRHRNLSGRENGMTFSL